MEKCKIEGFILLDLKSYNKIAVIMRVSHWCMERHI